MKDITITKQVFTLDELSPAARDKAIEKLCNDAYEYLPSELIWQDLNGRLVALLTGDDRGDIDGDYCKELTGLNLEYSLSYSQGDGVAIYGMTSKALAPLLEWGNADSARLNRNHWGRHYTHPNCFDVELFDTNGDTVVDGGELVKQFRGICRTLERAGYELITHLTSAEYVVQSMIDNLVERQFNDDGTLSPIEFWSER